MQPNHIVGTVCCATFLVARERVLRNPKDLYIALDEWIKTTVCGLPCLCAPLCARCTRPSPQDIPLRISGRFLEWTWHFIFGNPWRSYMPDPAVLCPGNPPACALDSVLNQAGL